MPFPLLALLGLGGAGAAAYDQIENDGDWTRQLGQIFAGTAGDLAGGATELAMEPVMRLIIHDDTLADEIARDITSGNFNAAMDKLLENVDQINFQGFAGLIAGGVAANSIANTLGLSGLRKFALIAPIAGIAATATSRLWTAVQGGDLEMATLFEDGNIWNAIMQGQTEGTEAGVEYRQQLETGEVSAPAAAPEPVD